MSMKIGDESDPNPKILELWKELYGDGENKNIPNIIKVAGVSVNTDGLTVEEVKLILLYIVDNYFVLQEDVQKLINEVINNKKSEWKLIKIERGSCIETYPPAEYINLIYETGTKKYTLEICDPSDHSLEEFMKEYDKYW